MTETVENRLNELGRIERRPRSINSERYHHVRKEAVPIGDSNLPLIRIQAGRLPATVDAAEDSLIAARADLYQRGGIVVRPTLSKFRTADGGDDVGLRLTPVGTQHVVECMTKAARFEKFDARRRRWVPTNCPPQIAETLLARGQWRLRPLNGIIAAPTLRADGSILDKPGYDDESGLLFYPCGIAFPAIPSTPTRSEAVTALDLLLDLLSTFSFVADEDRAVILSGLLTALIRRSLPTAPLHAITSPVAGSGKSMLVDMISTMVTGKPAPVIAQGRTVDEMQKRLGASLIAGDSIISIDNCSSTIGGDLLCQATTQQILRIRLLGYSQNIDVPSNASVFVTGNNLAIAGDMTRRTLLGSLDPKVERPELLTFPTDPRQSVREDRGSIVAAALTIMRAYHMTGLHSSVPALGSFEEWSHRVRDPLIWLGLPDPCITIEKTRRSDPKLSALTAVIQQWWLAAGSEKLLVKKLVETAANHPDLYAALTAVAGDGYGTVDNNRLGRWLNRNKGRVVGIGDGLDRRGAKITDCGILHGNSLWQVVMLTA